MAEPLPTKPKPKATSNSNSKSNSKVKSNAKRIHNSRPDESDAESSATAAKRARMTLQHEPRHTPGGTPKKYRDAQDAQTNIVTGKRARKQIQILDFEDAENSDEDGYRPTSASKSKTGTGTGTGNGSSGKSRGEPHPSSNGILCTEKFRTTEKEAGSDVFRSFRTSCESIHSYVPIPIRTV